MPRRLISSGDARPLLDIASYARRGPGRRDHLSQEEIELITRTVRRTPEVMVKVLSRGGQDLKSVGRHIAYLSRRGDVEIETDDGQRLAGKGIEKELLEDWDLDLEEDRRSADLRSRSTRTPSKLVHKLMFSMPPGTPANKVLAAVRNFAREEFGLKHRYAMVLHTDEPHPHVHMVVKAVSEQGIRLHIRKATLREWRREFARQLRAQGVAANATGCAVRGESKPRKSDAIYRAMLRGDSTHIRARLESVASNLSEGDLRVEPGRQELRKSRKEVELGWLAVSEMLAGEARDQLAKEVRQFLHHMPAVRTEREWLAAELLGRLPEPYRKDPKLRDRASR